MHKKGIVTSKNILLFLLAITILIGVFSFVFAINPATISTDKDDYAPEETVFISGSGFNEAIESNPINIQVTRPDASVHVCPDSYWCPNPLPTTSSFSDYPYILNGIEGEYIIDANDGTNFAQTTFTDSRTISWIKVNGGSSTTVSPGDTINVEVRVVLTSYSTWYSTRSKIEGESWECKDTPNHDSSGTYTESFTITAPGSMGTYDYTITAHGGPIVDNNCPSSYTSTLYTLNNAIIVEEPIPDAVCGNDILELGEECDNGEANRDDMDPVWDLIQGIGNRNYCSTECEIYSVPGIWCGDQVINGPEECDDGNNDDGDGCSSQCVDEYCGDGIVNNVDEQCDGSIGDLICSNVGNYNFGTLSCSNECMFDKSKCILDNQCPVVEVLIPPATSDITWYAGTINVKATVSDYQSGVKKARVILHDDTPITWSDGFFDMTYNSVQGRWEYNWNTLSAPIPGDCSVVYADVAGEDEAGNGVNNECIDTNRFGVDNAPPITVKSFGNPTVDKNLGDNYYVKTTTAVTLTATDCGSGVDYMHYEIWWDSDDNGVVDTELINTNVDDEITFYFGEESIHEIRWYAVDKLGNTETEHIQEHAVDDTPPSTLKQIIGPQYYDPTGGKTYIDGITTIELTCTDPQPHPVDNVVIYYRYRLDDGAWPTEFTIYRGPFGYPEESKHELEYYCVDALGNEAIHQFEIDYVDHTKPITILTFGTPFVQFSGYPKWITSQTPITLTATDDSQYEMCESGVKETKYRITQVDEIYCQTPDSGCSTAQGSGDFLTYSSLFTIPKQSCHLIEYYSIDNVEETETIKKECVFVDNTAPETTKTVGEHNVLIDPLCNPQTDICDYWVTQQTPITLSCVDQSPHPVDAVILHARYKVDSDPTTWIYLTTSKGYINFTFLEDSIHTLEWYCEDALGNRKTTQTEIDNVDTEGPIIVKWVDDTTVQPATQIRICANVTDIKQTQDLGVGVHSVWAILSLGDDPYQVILEHVEENTYCGNWVVPGIDSYCHEHRCVWDLEVHAKDLLYNYNKEDGVQIIVDQAKPRIEYVLNPVSGRYYRDGKPFSIYAPAIDFGGNWNILDYDNCKASGVYECRFYAFDYPFENINQTEIKNYWDYKEELDDVWNNPYVVPLGSVPYVDGVCKGIIEIPEESGLTDKVFLAYEIEDNAGNMRGNLARDVNDDLIIMDIDNEGPGVSITELGNTPGPLTSGDNIINLQAKIFEYDSGFDECWADLYKYDGKGYVDTGINLDGNAFFNLCEINDMVPYNLKSGNYQLKINARDELFNIGSDWAGLEIDNDRPAMSVMSPLKGEAYGDMFPVSLNVEDSAGIAAETVKIRITEIPMVGNIWCIFGTCEDTGWVLLTDIDGSIYSETIDLNNYEITGQGRYNFDAIACDNLYTPDDTTILGLDINLDRNSMHCRMISQHGADELVEEPIE